MTHEDRSVRQERRLESIVIEEVEASRLRTESINGVFDTVPGIAISVPQCRIGIHLGPQRLLRKGAVFDDRRIDQRSKSTLVGLQPVLDVKKLAAGNACLLGCFRRKHRQLTAQLREVDHVLDEPDVTLVYELSNR